MTKFAETRISRRSILRGVGGSAAAATLSTPFLNTRAAAADQLVIASYGSATTKTLQAGFSDLFTRKTGIKVSYADVPSPAAALVSAKGTGAYDLAMCTYVDVPPLLKANAIEALHANGLPLLSRVPERYRLLDSSGRVTGVGAYLSWYGIAVNQKLAKVEDFSSWEGLADPRWKGKIAVNRPQWGAAYELTIFSKALGGDERDATRAIELYKKVAGNALTAYSSIAHMLQLLTRQEIAAGPFYSQRVIELQREGNKDIAFAMPKEGVLALPYAFVVGKNTKNMDAAMKFLDFVMTPEPFHDATRVAAVLPIDPTIDVPADVQREFGLPLAELQKRIYAPDWAVVEANWRERTAICEQIFAR